MGCSGSAQVVATDEGASPSDPSDSQTSSACTRIWSGRSIFHRKDDTQNRPPAPAFLPDAEGMKIQVREQMSKPKYDVAIFYKQTGFAQWIARHPRFEQMTLAVIALNAIWLWIDTDHNPGSMLLNSPPLFQCVEYFFCIYFSFEWFMRFTAFKEKFNGIRDSWFVFDSFLVGTMVFETWLMSAVVLFVSGGGSGDMGNAGILRMARLLRLTRMARMARLLRAMPELLILMKGMIAAMRSVVFTMSLLFVMLYVFGIAFVQLCDGSECQELFPNVPEAMHELLLNAALMDGMGNLVMPLKEQNLLMMLGLYAFIFLSALTIMNMLIGVICEVVSAVAATERESLSLGFVRDRIHQLICETDADKDNDQMISKEEFSQLLVTPKAITILQDVGVDVVGLVDLKDTLFENDVIVGGEDDDQESVAEEPEEKKLSFQDLMKVVFDLRGGNAATVRDIVNLRKYIHARFAIIEQKLTRCSRKTSTFSPLAKSSRGPSRTRDELVTQTFLDSATTAKCQDALRNLQSLMSAHEVEMATHLQSFASMEAENQKLREQVSKLQHISYSSSLSEAHAVCKEIGLTTPQEALWLLQSRESTDVQPPKEAPRDLPTDDSCSSGDNCQEPVTAVSATLRATADGSAADDPARHGLDASTTDTVVAGGESACDAAADLSPTNAPVGQHSERRCSVVAASSAAMSVAAKSADEPW